MLINRKILSQWVSPDAYSELTYDRTHSCDQCGGMLIKPGWVDVRISGALAKSGKQTKRTFCFCVECYPKLVPNGVLDENWNPISPSKREQRINAYWEPIIAANQKAQADKEKKEEEEKENRFQQRIKDLIPNATKAKAVVCVESEYDPSREKDTERVIHLIKPEAVGSVKEFQFRSDYPMELRLYYLSGHEICRVRSINLLPATPEHWAMLVAELSEKG